MFGLIIYGIFLIGLMGLIMGFSSYVVRLGKIDIMLNSKYGKAIHK